MVLDRRMLTQGTQLAEGDLPKNPTGIESMLLENPEFSNVRGAGSLPSTKLNLDAATISDEENAQIDAQIAEQQVNNLFKEANIDPSQVMEEENLVGQETRDTLQKDIETIVNGDSEEGALKGVTIAGLSQTDRGGEQVAEDYKQFDTMIEEGGIEAVQRFVRSYLAPEKNKSSVPEWALPMTVFGVALQSEPGDWRQAILRAQGKTAQYMFAKGQAEKVAAAEQEATIREKALDIYTAHQQNKRLSSKQIVDIIGKGEVTGNSLKQFIDSGDPSDLVVTADTEDVTKLLDDFTVSSVAQYEESGDLSALQRLGNKPTETKLIDLLKEFTPSSVHDYIETGSTDQRVLVRKPSGTSSEANVLKEQIDLLELGYTPASIDKFLGSGKVSDLRMGSGAKAADYGTGEGGILRANLENLSNNLPTFQDKSEQEKIRALRKYVTAYGGLTTTKTETDQFGERTTQTKTPRGFATPSEFAISLGLSVENNEVATLLRENDKTLRFYPSEDIRAYAVLQDSSRKIDDLVAMINNPRMRDTLTGVSQEVMSSTTWRILSDVFPEMEIPKEITFWKAMQKALNVSLIEAITGEQNRFSDTDRKLVKEFLGAESFPDANQLLLDLQNVKQLLDRTKFGYEREMQSGVYQGVPETEEPEDRTERIDRLLNMAVDK